MSNVFVNFPIPEFERWDPVKSYTKALTLRQLADEREYRRVLAERARMQMAQDQREEAERQEFKAALAQGADPQTLIATNPELGLKHLTSLATMQTQQRAARKAQIDEQDAATKRQLGVNQRIADLGMEAVKIPLIDISPEDRAKGKLQPREEFFNQGVASTLIDAGITPAEQFGAFRVPKDVQAAQMYYSTVKGPDKLQDYLKAQAEAVQAAKMGPLQVAKAQADAAHAQQVLTGQALPSPQAAPALFHTWYGGWLLRNRKPDTPENRSLGIEEFNRQIHPQFDRPGVDVPYSPAVEAQQTRIAAAKAAANAAGKPPTAQENEAYGFYRRVTDAEQTLNTMEDHMKNLGMFGQTWYSYAPNWAQSDENQVVQQAQRQFTEARLRKESGAAIAPSEYENDKKTYFTQPGDSEAVRLRKKQARKVVIETIRRQAGKALGDEPEAPATPAASTAPAGLPKVGDTFQGSRVKSVTKVK